jgi:hypothetical protein
MLAFSEKPGDYNEIHFAATAQEETSSGLVRKEILRTGSWPVIPTKGGIVKKPLTIVLDGESNRENGVISLAAVKRGFDALKGKFKVQVPLSDDDDDHKNITRLNTGYVEELFIEGDKLVADILFTEADVKQKVLNGTYSDVSCGIPWEMVSRGEKYTTPLEHLCITNRPFIDGLGEFIAMSDGAEQVEITHFAEPGEPDPAHPEDPPPPRVVIREIDPFGGLSLLQIMEQREGCAPRNLLGLLRGGRERQGPRCRPGGDRAEVPRAVQGRGEQGGPPVRGLGDHSHGQGRTGPAAESQPRTSARDSPCAYSSCTGPAAAAG